MKRNIKMNFLMPLLLVSFVLGSCNENVFNQEGVVNAYMPQAAVFDGGLTNHYPVPMTSGELKNYEVDSVNHILNIYLGVKNSGRSKLRSYQVDVKANIDTTKKILLNGIYPKGVLLPAETYTLPEKVSVDTPTGSVFLLKTDLNKIAQDYPSYYKSTLILGVTISNPSISTINKKLATTIVAIDGKTFLPKPPEKNLIMGGDFADSSKPYWNIIHLNGNSIEKEPITKIANNKLTITSGTTGGYTAGAVYQAIDVEQGKRYKISMNVNLTGVLENAWLELHLGHAVPDPSADYNDHPFYGMSVWNCMTSPLAGDFSALSCSPSHPDGIYTASITGKVYFVIKFGTSGKIENLVIDDIKFVEIE